MLSLDINRLDKECFKEDGWYYPYTFQNRQVMLYRIKSGLLQILDHQVWIKLAQTSCHFGGNRYWFECPRCEARVGVLYLHHSNYACRKCYDLSYQTQRLSKIDRLALRLWRIRKRLGAPDNIHTPIMDKPKGMHWKTFHKLLLEERNLSYRFAKAVCDRLKLSLSIEHS